MCRIIVINPIIERMLRMYKEFPLNVNEDITECSVCVDSKVRTSDDFVTVLSTDAGEPLMFFNTDVLTLGMAMKMIATKFVQLANETCSPDELQAIAEILGDDFVTLTEENLT